MDSIVYSSGGILVFTLYQFFKQNPWKRTKNDLIRFFTFYHNQSLWFKVGNLHKFHILASVIRQLSNENFSLVLNVFSNSRWRFVESNQWGSFLYSTSRWTSKCELHNINNNVCLCQFIWETHLLLKISFNSSSGEFLSHNFFFYGMEIIQAKNFASFADQSRDLSSNSLHQLFNKSEAKI